MADRSQWTLRRIPSDFDDDLSDLEMSQEERGRLVWRLSREQFSIAAQNGTPVYDESTDSFITIDRGDLERRLPRAAFRITRR